MKSSPSLSLDRYLSEATRNGQATPPSVFITEGASYVSPHDLTALTSLLPQVRSKCAKIADSERLRRRIALLTQYFEETYALGATEARRETAFVLYYFLKGYDLIPDSIPTIGFLDDALLIEAVVNRNREALRAHWAHHQRAIPQEL